MNSINIMCAILFDFMSYASMRLGENIIDGMPLEAAKDKFIHELFAQAKFEEIYDVCQGIKAIIHSIQPMTVFSTPQISCIITNPVTNTETNTAYTLPIYFSSPIQHNDNNEESDNDSSSEFSDNTPDYSPPVNSSDNTPDYSPPDYK